MIPVFITPRAARLRTEFARRVFTAEGLTLVDQPESARWAIAYKQEEVNRYGGVIPHLMFHTYEPHFTRSIPWEGEMAGSRVYSFSLWTSGVADTWKHFFRQGTGRYEDPADPRRSGTAFLATDKPRLHGTIAEELTSVRRAVAVRGYERGLVNIYGKDWTGVEVTGESRAPVDASWAFIKHDLLQDYKFNLCMENAYTQGFLTEKLWQALRAGTLPIYVGSHGLDRIVGTGDYVDVRDFSSADALWDAIEAMPDSERIARVRALQDRLIQVERETAETEGDTIASWARDVADRIHAIEDLHRLEAGPWSAGQFTPRRGDDGDKAPVMTAGVARAPRVPTGGLDRDRRALRVCVASDARHLQSRQVDSVLANSGWDFVDDVSRADWLITGTAANVEAHVGKVPAIVLHTWDPAQAAQWRQFSAVAGTEVYVISPWTHRFDGGIDFFMVSGTRYLRSPGEGDRTGIAVPPAGSADGTRVRGALGVAHERAVRALAEAGVETHEWHDDLDGAAIAGRHEAMPHGVVGQSRFALCLDTALAPGLVGSRVWHAIRAGALPVVAGSHSLERLVTPGTLVSLNDYDSPGALAQAVARMPDAERASRVARLQGDLSLLDKGRCPAPELVRVKWVEEIIAFVEGIDESRRRGETWLGVEATTARVQALDVAP